MIKVRAQTRSSSYWRRGTSSALLGLVVLLIVAGTLACGDERIEDGRWQGTRHRPGIRRYGLRGHLPSDGGGPAAKLQSSGRDGGLRAARRPPFPRRVRWPGRISSPVWTRGGTVSTTSSTVDPETMMPYLSTSHTEDADEYWKLGDWQVFLLAGPEVSCCDGGSLFGRCWRKPGWRPPSSGCRPIFHLPGRRPAS